LPRPDGPVPDLHLRVRLRRRPVIFPARSRRSRPTPSTRAYPPACPPLRRPTARSAQAVNSRRPGPGGAPDSLPPGSHRVGAANQQGFSDDRTGSEVRFPLPEEGVVGSSSFHPPRCPWAREKPKEWCGKDGTVGTKRIEEERNT